MKIIKKSDLINNFSEYLTIIIAIISISGATIYYIYALNMLGLILSLILAIIIFLTGRPFFCKKTTPHIAEKYVRTDYLLLTIYGLSYLLMFSILWHGRSDRSLVSPWPMINYNFFWLYALASGFLIAIANRKKFHPSLKILFISAHYFISFAIALIIYKIGYGFDPFVHRATMELIDSKGLVTPKPVYYLGQYSLIIIIHKLSNISISFLNNILGPFLSALLLPPVLYNFLKNADGDNDKTQGAGLTINNGIIFTTIIFILILGFTPFILTTPQNLSYLFLLLTIFSSLSRAPLRYSTILAMATVSLHPLAGLPALAWIAWLAINKNINKLSRQLQKISRLGVWLFSALSLPISLFIAAGANWHNAASGYLETLKNIINYPDPTGRETCLLNFIYFFANNYRLMLIIVMVIALLYSYQRYHNSLEFIKIKGLAWVGSGLAVAYLLSGLIRFDGLIDYEQAAYAERIPLIIIIFFSPYITLLFQGAIKKIYSLEREERIIWLVFGIASLSVSLYISYPRFDKYLNSHGYSTSANDLAAVRLIEAEAQAPYAVLANQQVSAAALSVFGFDHYYQTSIGPIYFYPIPTGGALYQYYLAAVYKTPQRSNLAGACTLTDAKEIYLIVNKYWYQSSRIINEAKLEAERWWTINNEVYIFKYSC